MVLAASIRRWLPLLSETSPITVKLPIPAAAVVSPGLSTPLTSKLWPALFQVPEPLSTPVPVMVLAPVTLTVLSSVVVVCKKVSGASSVNEPAPEKTAFGWVMRMEPELMARVA